MVFSSKVELYVFLLLFFGYSEAYNQCHMEKEIMDCSNKNLTDCPNVDNTVTKLNLSNNELTNFTTKNCQNLIHLQYLWIENNKLVKFIISDNFTNLYELSVKNNLITSANLKSLQVKNVDLSNNKLVELNIEETQIIKLNLANNKISKKSLSQLFNNLMTGPKIISLDLSYNGLSVIDSSWTSFHPAALEFFNLAGNKFKSILFYPLPKIAIGKAFFNFSGNSINSWWLKNDPKLDKVDFSSNNLSMFSSEMLEYLHCINKIDLSNNPIKCDCKINAEFSIWIDKYKSLLINKHKTFCENKKLISTFICNSTKTTTTSATTATSATTTTHLTTTKKGSTTTTTNTITTTTTKPNSTTKIYSTEFPGTTQEVPLKASRVWIIIVVVFIILALLIIILGRFYCKRRHAAYNRIINSDTDNLWNTETTPTCIDCIPFNNCFGRQRRNPSSIGRQYGSLSVNSDWEDNNQSKLIIFCSHNVTPWTRTHITTRIANQTNILVVDTILKKSELAQLINGSNNYLVVIYDNKCLNSPILSENVKNLLSWSSDWRESIRLFLYQKNIDNHVLVKNNRILYKFVRDSISDRRNLINYDMEDNYLITLNLWLSNNTV